MKICAGAAELFHADGQTDRQTDMMKPVVAFRNFVNAPTNGPEDHTLSIFRESQKCFCSQVLSNPYYSDSRSLQAFSVGETMPFLSKNYHALLYSAHKARNALMKSHNSMMFAN